MKDLAGRLLYLPLDLDEKIFLWLTFKGIKPVSEITAERRGNFFSLAKRGIHRKSKYDYNSANSRRIRGWIKDAGLVMMTNGSEWHVGKEKNKISESLKIIRKFDYDNEIKSGLLFGFPKKSVEAYSHNRIVKENDQIPMMGIGVEKYENKFLKDKYYTPYILYNVPLRNVEEDSLTAKKWADTIRKDIPKLAKWFEKKEVNRRKKEERAQKFL